MEGSHTVMVMNHIFDICRMGLKPRFTCDVNCYIPNLSVDIWQITESMLLKLTEFWTVVPVSNVYEIRFFLRSSPLFFCTMHARVPLKCNFLFNFFLQDDVISFQVCLFLTDIHALSNREKTAAGGCKTFFLTYSAYRSLDEDSWENSKFPHLLFLVSSWRYQQARIFTYARYLFIFIFLVQYFLLTKEERVAWLYFLVFLH
jgi:hypothetical protein